MTRTFKKSLAAVTVAAAAFALPSAAMAGDYRQCNDTEAAVAGGLIGGSLGTILGEEIAGRGDKTEGAIAGALIGGVIGAAIGDGVSDCEKDGRIYRNGQFIGATPAYTQVHHRGQHRDYRRDYRRGSEPHHRGRGYRDRDRRGHGYTRAQHDRDLRQIDRRINRLRNERRDLKHRARYERGRWINRRLNEISYELDYLKDERRRVKRAWDNRRQPSTRPHYRDRRW